MSAKSGGSFAALLMSGPLAAIPFMALFGVPQFGSVSEPPVTEADGILRRPQDALVEPLQSPDLEVPSVASSLTETEVHDRSSPSDQSLTTDTRVTSLSEFPLTHATSPSSGSSKDHMDRPASQFAFLSNRDDDELGESPSRSPRKRPTPTTLATTRALVTPSLPWENAAQELQELGIDDYRLERGHDENTYVFICQFAQAGDERVVRRFEAEAAEPAAAVQIVVQRVTQWRQQVSTY